MAEGLQENDIRSAVQAGGRIDGAFVVQRASEKWCFVVYVRPSWKRGFYILRTFRDRADREYRDLRLLLGHIRNELGYYGAITVHRAGDPALARFRNLSPSDCAEVSVPGGAAPKRRARRSKEPVPTAADPLPIPPSLAK